MLNRLTIALAVVFILILLINYQIMKLLDHPPESPLVIAKRQPYGGSTTPAAPSQAWKETDPKELEKYGISITTIATEPTSPEGWELYLDTYFQKFKVLESAEAKETIKEMETTPEEYKKKVTKLKEDEKTVQKRLDEDPFNEVYQAQLQNIYKLQALGKILEKKGIVKDNPYIASVVSTAPSADPSAAPTAAPSTDMSDPLLETSAQPTP